MKTPDRVIISRTDSIGDVILTLPLAGAIKQGHPECTVIFPGRDYTKEVAALSRYVDEFVNWDSLKNLIDKHKFNLILHPKSKGSAREWPLDHFNKLVSLLPEKKFKIFVTGTREEGEMISTFLEQNKNKRTDLTGQFPLRELILFIHAAEGLVAASTGPLHLAAAMDKLAVVKETLLKYV